jgi:hypothetical protein
MCSYQHHEGQMRLRATTLSRRWVAGSGGVQVSSLQESIFFSFCFCLYPFLGLVELICSVILSVSCQPVSDNCFPCHNSVSVHKQLCLVHFNALSVR